MSDRDVIRINCQSCKASLGIAAENFTEEGKTIICPRCQKSVFLKRSQLEKFFEYSMHCPKCGMLQKTSEECIYCNVIISKFLKYKGLDSAWDILSERFKTKNPVSEDVSSLSAAQELIVKCPNCRFSKKISKNHCPSYFTRIKCPNCDQLFDIIPQMHVEN
jgi:hypothetical protein